MLDFQVFAIKPVFLSINEIMCTHKRQFVLRHVLYNEIRPDKLENRQKSKKNQWFLKEILLK